MNPNPSSARVRFTCRIVRQWSALTGAADSRHAASCPDCQEFFGAATALEAALRRDATRSQPVMSTGFERRILNAVRAASEAGDATPSSRRSEPQRSRRGSRYLAPAWTGGLAVAALAAIVLWSNRTSRPPRDFLSADDAKLVVNAVQTMSTQLVGSVLPSTGEFVANNPLQQEVESLYADARSALGFLGMNFLPGSAEKPRPSSG